MPVWHSVIVDRLYHPHEAMRKEGKEMPYYEPCPRCGANLDPGEKCDCKEVTENGRERQGEPAATGTVCKPCVCG